MRAGWRRYRDGLAAGAALIVCGLMAGRAGAEMLSALFPEGVPGYDTAPGVTVLSRARPGQETRGIRAGAFILRPLLEQAIGYDDNVLAGGRQRGSWLVGTRPSLLVGSDWSRDAFGASVSLSDTRYPGMQGQSRTDGAVSVGGALDVGQDRLTLAVAHVTRHQDRTQIDALPADRPLAITVDDARASFAASFGRWTLTPNLEAARWRFGDTTIMGVPSSQAYRDRTVLQGGLTIRYEWAPLRNLVLVTRAVGQHHTSPVPGQASLDSTSYQVLAGLDYDDNAVWRYRLLLGGESRHFAASAFRTHAAFIAEAEAAWMPTGLTTVRGTLTRSMEDAAQEGVAGFTLTGAKLTIDHEYLRDVLLSASVGLQHAAFLQGGGRQTFFSFGAGATWLVNRSISVSATYNASGIRGAYAAVASGHGSYNRNLALLTLRLGL